MELRSRMKTTTKQHQAIQQTQALFIKKIKMSKQICRSNELVPCPSSTSFPHSPSCPNQTRIKNENKGVTPNTQQLLICYLSNPALFPELTHIPSRSRERYRQKMKRLWKEEKSRKKELLRYERLFEHIRTASHPADGTL